MSPRTRRDGDQSQPPATGPECPAAGIDRESFVPPYYQLARILADSVRRGDLAPGDPLPAEPQLARMYGLSRMTVRKAIERIAELGLVTALPGKGTFVNQPPLEAATFRLSGFEEDMRSRGLKPSSRLLRAQALPADEETARRLKLRSGQRVLLIKRLLLADGEPMAYDLKYLRYDRGRPILEGELEYLNLPGIMSHHSKDLPAESRFVVRVGPAGEEEARALGIETGAPVFVVEQSVYSGNGAIIGWGVLIYRGDRYCFTSLPRLL